MRGFNRCNMGKLSTPFASNTTTESSGSLCAHAHCCTPCMLFDLPPPGLPNNAIPSHMTAAGMRTGCPSTATPNKGPSASCSSGGQCDRADWTPRSRANGAANAINVPGGTGNVERSYAYAFACRLDLRPLSSPAERDLKSLVSMRRVRACGHHQCRGRCHTGASAGMRMLRATAAANRSMLTANGHHAPHSTYTRAANRHMMTLVMRSANPGRERCAATPGVTPNPNAVPARRASRTASAPRGMPATTRHAPTPVSCNRF